MGWKKNRQPKPSISSVTSMSFLTEQNLTFHRFSDGTMACEGQKKNPLCDPAQSIWATEASLDYSNPTLMANESAVSTTKILPSTIEDSIDARSDAASKRYSTYSVGNNSTLSSTTVNNTGLHNGSTMKLIQVQKDDASDTSSKQSRCSIFRGTILCLCMNLTYANIVRFPRELERHGVAFLVPYLLIMFLIGVPVLLLEMALGQFLGQGAAHSWKASPFFKGAAIVGRIGSWLGCIWISMQMSLALIHIGQMSFSGVPFRHCPSTVQLVDNNKYEEVVVLGQRCLQKTFLRPVNESSLSFGLLAIGLVFIWVIVMMCTHSSRVNRRSMLMFGLATFGLLLFQLGWQVSNTIQTGLMPQTWPFNLDVLAQSSTWFYALVQVIMSTQIGIGAVPVVTGKFLYKGDALRMCSIYMCFNFLVTIIATAYYMTTFDLHNLSARQPPIYADLTTITSIYDRAFVEAPGTHLRSLIPSLAYLMVFLAGVVSLSIAIYTSSRLIKRHPNYIMCLVAMFGSILLLLCPHFTVSRFLDLRWTGLVIVCALVFEIIAVTWVYGIKDLSIDLEFSIGRPILRLWLVLWSLVPLMLVAIVACFIALPPAAVPSTIEPIARDLVPKWVPIVVCLVLIALIAMHETTKQVDYNTFSMIHGATRAAKDWGPADPLVRHAWKQWKSVCDDTGQRDFTLKRRGTKDWTNSIKKGQYTHAKRNSSSLTANSKYSGAIIGAAAAGAKTHLHHHLATQHSHQQTSTGGSNSPNYSGSVFGDSAIEEDISCGEKYSSTERNANGSSRRSSSTTTNNNNNNNNNMNMNRQQSDASQHQHRLYQSSDNDNGTLVDEMNKRNSRNYQKVPIRIAPLNDHLRIVKRNSYLQAQNNDDDDDDDDDLCVDSEQHFTSRIEILPPEIPSFTIPPPPPPAQFQAQSTFMPITPTTTKNPLCHLHDAAFYHAAAAAAGNNNNNNDRHRNGHNSLINNILIGSSGGVDAGYSDHGSYSTRTSASKTASSNRTPSDAAYNDNWRRLHSAGSKGGNARRNHAGDEFSTEL